MLGIVSLVHQDAKKALQIITNLQRHVHGNFVLALHYNGNDDIPAEKIPKWVRLATPGETARFSRSLSDAVIRCLRLLDDCDNVLLLTSGSLFIRTWTIPNKLGICLRRKDGELHNRCSVPVPTTNTIRFLTDLQQHLWAYEKVVNDVGFNEALLKRGYSEYYNAQLQGQIWPYEIASRILRDAPIWGKYADPLYQCEEIYFSTYAYAFAVEKREEIHPSLVSTAWDGKYALYQLSDIEDHKAVAVSKVVDDSPLWDVYSTKTDTRVISLHVSFFLPMIVLLAFLWILRTSLKKIITTA